MAIIPSSQYPSQTDTSDANYPHGKARNETNPGDRNGWPLEKEWVNDILGFQQALLSAASIEPSGSPDNVSVSQYLEAVRHLTGNINGNVHTTGYVRAAGGLWSDSWGFFTGDLEVIGGSLLGGDVACASACTVAGAASLNGGCTTTVLQCTGIANTGSSTFIGAVTCVGTVTINGLQVYGTTGRRREKISAGSAADITLAPGAVYVGNIATNQSWALPLTDVEPGDWIEVTNNGAGLVELTVSGTGIITLSNTAEGADNGVWRTAKVYFLGGSWVIGPLGL